MIDLLEETVEIGNSDYYKLLGVSKAADEATIHKAYLNAMHAHYPDFHPENSTLADLARQLNIAKTTLLNRELRKEYDRQLKHKQQNRFRSKIVKRLSKIHFQIPDSLNLWRAVWISGIAMFIFFFLWGLTFRDKVMSTPYPTLENSIGMQFMELPAGSFMMGERDNAREVNLTNSFHLGIYEVTQEQYEEVMESNPSEHKGPQNPVDRVAWCEAVEFCKRLSDRPEEQAANRVYRLPTEAEWEYACRAGGDTEYSFGNDESQLDQYAWFGANAKGSTRPVGQKKPNAWGFYDMHGNVDEWCRDRYGDYPPGKATDPKGAASGPIRVLRGGRYGSSPGFCRTANRAHGSEQQSKRFHGFRVFMTLSTTEGADLALDTPSRPQDLPSPASSVPPKESINPLPSIVSVENSLGMRFHQLPAGSFLMGDADTVHEVTLSEPYFLAVYEVTQEQFSEVMDDNPSKHKGPQHPVDHVTWNEAKEFCERLSQRREERMNNRAYRLPTEAEWEYACRAGTSTVYSFGSKSSSLREYGWFRENSNRSTHPIGQKRPNAWGLFDMHGNVEEWCQDKHGDYSGRSEVNPSSPTNGFGRVLRGGRYDSTALRCESSYRRRGIETSRDWHGLRVVMYLREAQVGSPEEGSNALDSMVPSPPSKQRIPNQEQLDLAHDSLDQIFSERIKQAQSLPSLAHRGHAFRSLAMEAFELQTQDPSERYLLLHYSVNWATEAGDAVLTHENLAELESQFEIDKWPYLLNAVYAWNLLNEDYFQEQGQDAILSARQRLLTRLFQYTEEAISERRFIIARDFLKLSLQISADDDELQDHLRERFFVINNDAEHQIQMKQLEEDLKNAPNPDASLELGKYWCLYMENWQKGLSYLSQGSDPSFRQLAELEFAAAESQDLAIDVGDQCWEMSSSRQGQEREALRRRAVAWYRRGSHSLIGLAEHRVEGRIEEFSRSQREKNSNE